MKKIAFIDDGIDPAFLKRATSYVSHKAEIEPYDTPTKEVMRMSHGTLCAKMFEEACSLYNVESDYTIISIQYKSTEESGHIDNLIAALELCEELKPDVISMSIGMTEFCNSKALYSVIKKLYNQNIIMFASTANNGKRTMPACIPEVIGCRHNRDGVMRVGELVYDEEDFFGVEVDINSQINKDIFSSNSFATPTVVARIIDHCTDPRSTRHYLKRISNQEKLRKIVQQKNEQILGKTSVWIYCNIEASTAPLCLQLMDLFEISDASQYCMGLDLTGSIMDERVLNYICEMPAESLMRYLDIHSDADVLFCICDSQTFHLIDKNKFDLSLEEAHGCIQISIDGNAFCSYIGNRNARDLFKLIEYLFYEYGD